MRKILLVVCVILLWSCSVGAEDLTLSWEYDADIDNVDGFKIYASTTSGEFTENDEIADVEYTSGEGEYSTEATLEGEPGTSTIYYFVATVYNEKTESEYSNEVSKDIIGSPESLKCSIKTE